jgi:hypothetical protein
MTKFGVGRSIMRGLLSTSLLLAFHARGNAQTICPESLQPGNISVAPAGWEVFGVEEPRIKRHSLDRVTFTDGHPREKAFLRPTASLRKSNGDRVDRYVFTPVSEDGIALVCEYAHTRQSLFRLITATTCEVTASGQPQKARQRVRRIDCR